MGGVMPDRERDAAIKRLRKAAERADKEQRITTMYKVNGRKLDRSEWPAMLEMAQAWREFPECQQDDQVPSPEEILRRCDAYDRQKAEAEIIDQCGTAAMLQTVKR
jgi:hypothetical protein